MSPWRTIVMMRFPGVVIRVGKGWPAHPPLCGTATATHGRKNINQKGGVWQVIGAETPLPPQKTGF